MVQSNWINTKIITITEVQCYIRRPKTYISIRFSGTAPYFTFGSVWFLLAVVRSFYFLFKYLVLVFFLLVFLLHYLESVQSLNNLVWTLHYAEVGDIQQELGLPGKASL